MSGIRSIVAPVVALALIALITVGSATCAAVGVGQKAPEFNLGSVNGDGNVKLSDTIGKTTVLVFWHSRCPHCVRELPVLQSVYKDLKSKGLVIVGVSVDTNIGDAASFAKHHGITFPMAYGGGNAGNGLMNSYGVRGVPTLFVIDDKGIVRMTHIGETDTSTIKADAERLGVK